MLGIQTNFYPLPNQPAVYRVHVVTHPNSGTWRNLYRRYDDQATTVQAFLSGHVDLIVTGSPIAATMIKQNPHKKIERKFIIQHSPCHIGIRKGEVDLLYWVNVFIYRKKLSGDLDKLSKKWFGESLPELPAF